MFLSLLCLFLGFFRSLFIIILHLIHIQQIIKDPDVPFSSPGSSPPENNNSNGDKLIDRVLVFSEDGIELKTYPQLVRYLIVHSILLFYKIHIHPFSTQNIFVGIIAFCSWWMNECMNVDLIFDNINSISFLMLSIWYILFIRIFFIALDSIWSNNLWTT